VVVLEVADPAEAGKILKTHEKINYTFKLICFLY
jgi:hypothetical protein